MSFGNRGLWLGLALMMLGALALHRTLGPSPRSDVPPSVTEGGADPAAVTRAAREIRAALAAVEAEVRADGERFARAEAEMESQQRLVADLRRLDDDLEQKRIGAEEYRERRERIASAYLPE